MPCTVCTCVYVFMYMYVHCMFACVYPMYIHVHDHGAKTLAECLGKRCLYTYGFDENSQKTKYCMSWAEFWHTIGTVDTVNKLFLYLHKSYNGFCHVRVCTFCVSGCAYLTIADHHVPWFI